MKKLLLSLICLAQLSTVSADQTRKEELESKIRKDYEALTFFLKLPIMQEQIKNDPSIEQQGNPFLACAFKKDNSACQKLLNEFIDIHYQFKAEKTKYLQTYNAEVKNIVVAELIDSEFQEFQKAVLKLETTIKKTISQDLPQQVEDVLDEYQKIVEKLVEDVKQYNLEFPATTN